MRVRVAEAGPGRCDAGVGGFIDSGVVLVEHHDRRRGIGEAHGTSPVRLGDRDRTGRDRLGHQVAQQAAQTDGAGQTEPGEFLGDEEALQHRSAAQHVAGAQQRIELFGVGVGAAGVLDDDG